MPIRTTRPRGLVSCKQAASEPLLPTASIGDVRAAAEVVADHVATHRAANRSLQLVRGNHFIGAKCLGVALLMADSGHQR